ncbi:glutathione S-transferase family protein [Alphaproteobacteria bacterium]|jgi:putative glutathione S-transferase|nr:glutathione S-transferase family protein [Alphaproteobacteria bacterium]MDB2583812.1 glutathione S-transferase family protein [Alphaproteobacteria bacterium]MDB3916716.1 glutathione S-transferase family protein [Alphaproteobacteria bacterium]
MGQLIDGVWVKGSVSSNDQKGSFKRASSVFRNKISSNHSTYLPETNRYHLYVSYACPWAHRTLIFRKLKNLESHISVDYVHPDMLEMGWSFEKNFPGTSGDSLHNKRYVHEIYQLSDKDISTKATVPILWDKKTRTIVNNESAEIIRIMNDAFNDITKNKDDYYPEKFRDQIDSINDTIYENINNGVYRSGFSKTQNSYEEAVKNLFTSLDMVNDILEGRNYLVGDILTEADIRLVPTLIRFDCVYYFHFKCNLKKISEYKNISRYLRNLLEEDAIKSTTNFEHIKRHYFYSHENINPFRIIPIGPENLIS